ncbi:endolytic transglycosylase MltG [Sporosarcina contaminans]|uniref:Endolytic transglycosylase MltG n=1 Tax=Sporosarcina contaminans TaxID=633403 RepID=A0ABW3TT22_9BACL
MIRDLFRAVGIGCIISGGILYVADTSSSSNPTESSDSYKEQLQAAEAELAKVKKELATAQISSAADSVDTKNSKTETQNNDVVSSDPIMKTILTIERGSNSSDVASKLERAGLIENAREFEQYLREQHLSGRIQIGEYEIDSTMDMKKIASLITGAQ